MRKYFKSISTGEMMRYNPERHNSYDWENMRPATEEEYNAYYYWEYRLNRNSLPAYEE